MSRIGKLPVKVPAGVTVSINGSVIKVKGPKGELVQSFNGAVSLELTNNEIIVKPHDETRLAKAMYGTARSIIANMVEGVTKGYLRELELQGVGFKGVVKGKSLVLNLGYSHEINYDIPNGIVITVTDNVKIKVEGADKHRVGQTAADIYHFYKVEPYKGKGVRMAGQVVRRKEGKKAA